MAYRKILVGLEDTSAARKALTEGTRLALALGARLHVVIVQKRPHQEEWTEVECTPSERTTRLLKEAVEIGQKRGTAVEGQILFGDAVPIFDDFIKKNGIEVLIIGRPRHSALAGRILGRAADALIRTVACPVLVVN